MTAFGHAGFGSSNNQARNSMAALPTFGNDMHLPTFGNDMHFYNDDPASRPGQTRPIPAQQPPAQPLANQVNNSLQRTGQPGSMFGPAINMQGYQQGPSSTNVYTPFGNFPNLQAFQNQQDAFVQQHLQNQAGYNAGLMSGQAPQRVPLMDSWQQAGDNIASGVYQGNPLATGNMAGLANLFSQYGMTMQPGFQDQLMQLIGQQSAPSLYSPPGATSFPVGPNGEYWPGFNGPQATIPAFGGQPQLAPREIPKFINPVTGLPYGMPAPSQPTPAPTPQPAPERAPWQPPPAPPGGWRNEQQRRDAEYQSRVEYMMNPPAPAAPPPAASVTPRPPSPPLAGGDQRQQWRDAGMPGYDPSRLVQQVVTDGWANPNQSDAYQNWLRSQGQPSDMGGGPGGQVPGGGMGQQDPAYQEWRRGIITDARARQPEERAAQERRLYDQYLREQQRQQQAPPTPGYGGAIGVPVDQRRFNDIIDRDGDGVDDRFQPGPGQPNPEWSKPIADSWRPQQPPPPAFAPPGAARPIPPSGQGTPYEPPPPLRAQPGTSGPGWRESGGVRIYDGFTANQGTGTPGVMGPDHIRPGLRRDPVTGQEVYDPFTDPIATGGGPATPHNAPIGNTWGTGRPVPPPLRRDPILDPRPTVRPPPMRRNPRNDLYLG